MTDTQTPTPPKKTSKPRGVSLYDRQWEHAKKRAQELTDMDPYSKPVSASEYIQKLIDADMRKHSNTKPQ